MSQDKSNAGDAAQAPVLFEEVEVGGGLRIGYARLNRPAQVNALDLQMCELMLEKFRRWRSNESIVAVVLTANGTKGFSAGGDVAGVVREVRAGGDHRFEYGDLFFEVEYTLDRLIHTYPKPFITHAFGICMGGGVGLTVGGSHRIVSDRCRIAMPEIHIGLFPDVGGGWFLNRVPGGLGRVLALTGMMINEADALFAGFADAFVPGEESGRFHDQLHALEWTRDCATNHRLVTALLGSTNHRYRGGLPVAGLSQYYDALRFIATQPDVPSLLAALQSAAEDDPFFEAAAKGLGNGSPTTALVADEYIRRSVHLSLPEVLELDLVLARQFQRRHDFAEGVRALLIDKDRKPTWAPDSFDAVDPADVAGHFEPLTDRG